MAPVALRHPQGEIRGAAWGRQVHARLRKERRRGHGVQAEGVPETDASELRRGELLARQGGVQHAIGAVKRPLPEGAEAARGDSGWRWRWRVLQQAHLLMCNLEVTAAAWCPAELAAEGNGEAGLATGEAAPDTYQRRSVACVAARAPPRLGLGPWSVRPGHWTSVAAAVVAAVVAPVKRRGRGKRRRGRPWRLAAAGSGARSRTRPEHGQWGWRGRRCRLGHGRWCGCACPVPWGEGRSTAGGGNGWAAARSGHWRGRGQALDAGQSNGSGGGNGTGGKNKA